MSKHPKVLRQAATPNELANPQPLTVARRRLFLAISLLVPLLVLVLLEGALRLAWPAGAIPLFVRAPMGAGQYLMANPRVATRWFITESKPPNPRMEPFAAVKPRNGYRVFALGESSTAGFPYPRNVAFSRLLRDALRDVLPDDSVEVINLGIPATNTYALLDEAGEVIEQKPDAIVLYAGHNEYYGALGVGSTERLGGATLVKALLVFQRLRTVMALRKGTVWMRAMVGGAHRTGAEEASFMESLAGNQSIELGSPTYRRGAQQFADNLSAVILRFRRAGIPVLVASQTWNLRDQPPLASPANGEPGGADSAFAGAKQALASGDTAAARRGFERARDLDVLRFRAPGEFNAIIRRVAAATGATYVAMAERFAAASPAGLTGHELFLEHVHPVRRGYALMGEVFFEAMRACGLLGRARFDRLRPWSDYERGQEMTAFDERIAAHTVRTLQTRWPFVDVSRQIDYRGTYVPKDLADSMAFMVSRGMPWEYGKLRLAEDYERRGKLDSAVAEYRGLVRDSPFFEEPNRLLGLALVAAGRSAEAEEPLRRAIAIQPTAGAVRTLALIEIQRKRLPQAIQLLQLALRIQPDQPDVLYQLAAAFGATGKVANARLVTRRLAQVAPNHPGLPLLLQALQP